MSVRAVVGVFAATVLFVAACSENSHQIASQGGAPAGATVEANAAVTASSTATSRESTGGLWFAPERITAGAGGTLVTGMGGVARVTPSGVTTVMRAQNVNGALAAAGETWLAYAEADNANFGYRLVVGTVGADGAATPRFEVPGRVSDRSGSASVSGAGRYIAFLWRMPSGSNWNPGRLVVSADGGKSFQLVDTPTGGGIAVSPLGTALIVGGPGNNKIYASTNVLTEAFVDVTPQLTAGQTFHDPIYVNGRFIALAVSHVTTPNTVTVISSRNDGQSWAYSDLSGNAPLQLDIGTFQIASTDGLTVSTLFTTGSCAGFKTTCSNTVEVRYSADAGKSFQTVAAQVTPT